MPIFDWNNIIKNIPPEWRATKGKGVRIAIIDSGVDLSHPDLAHLKETAGRFFVARPGFTTTADPLPADDDIEDAVGHGTKCTSVLAARTTGAEGLAGMAPEADYLLIKATDMEGRSRNTYFLEALAVALKKQAEIIVVSYVPTEKRKNQDTQIKNTFTALAAGKVVLCVALDNTDLFSEFNKLRYPADHEWAVATGVVTDRLWKNGANTGAFNSKVAALLPYVNTSYIVAASKSVKNDNASVSESTGPVASEQTSTESVTSDQQPSKIATESAGNSIANACFAGLVALYLAHLKQTAEEEVREYVAPDKAELLTALASILAPLDEFDPDNPDYRFYKPRYEVAPATTASDTPA
jgi:subtilisin family serine protease